MYSIYIYIYLGKKKIICEHILAKYYGTCFSLAKKGNRIILVSFTTVIISLFAVLHSIIYLVFNGNFEQIGLKRTVLFFLFSTWPGQNDAK